MTKQELKMLQEEEAKKQDAKGNLIASTVVGGVGTGISVGRKIKEGKPIVDAKGKIEKTKAKAKKVKDTASKVKKDISEKGVKTTGKEYGEKIAKRSAEKDIKRADKIYNAFGNEVETAYNNKKQYKELKKHEKALDKRAKTSFEDSKKSLKTGPMQTKRQYNATTKQVKKELKETATKKATAKAASKEASKIARRSVTKHAGKVLGKVVPGGMAVLGAIEGAQAIGTLIKKSDLKKKQEEEEKKLRRGY